MKKILLLFAFQALCIYSFAQKTVFFNEGFATMPPTGWTIDAQSGNWSASASNNAGGTSPEAHFYYNPTFTATSSLISPAVNTTGLSQVFLSFKHMFSGVYGNYTIGIATRSSSGDTWTTTWSIVNPTTGQAANELLLLINNADVGSATFQICFFFSGYSYNIDDWYIDNVMLFEPYGIDAKMVSNNLPLYIAPGSINITGTVKNFGKSNITGMTLNYKVGAAASQSTVVSGLNLTSGQNYNYTLTPAWIPTAGSYIVTTWISDVNTLGADSCNTNDTIRKNVGVATQTTTCKPVFEEFTSSTCAPCASFNSSTFTPFINSNGTQFSLIKYQMNWPGSGDPYYTAEGGVRRGYYGVSSVPDLYVDGRASGMTSGTMLSELNADIGKGTFFVISGLNPTYTDNTVTVPLTITPYVTGAFKLFVVVIEKTTTGNVGSNGETSWKHVMMKMLTGGSGATVNFITGTNYTNTYTQNMSATNVEEMSDLQVVIMIQEYSTKEIYQSAESDIAVGIDVNSDENITIYPNPASENLSINNALNSDIMLYDVYGKLVMSENKIDNHYLLNVSELAKGTYILKIINGDKISSKKITVIK